MTVRALTVTEVRFAPASDHDERQGLVGYVALVLNDALRLDGLTLRRSGDDELYLAYPTRTDGAGCRHALLRPLDDEARRWIEEQVFAELGIGEGSP